MSDKARAEHLVWCKRRALEYLDRGDIPNAITSMLSDLNKHDETRAVGEKMSMLGLFAIQSGDIGDARRFIEGFR